MNKNLFNSVKMAAPAKNFFDLSHDVKLSFKMGKLIPICAVDLVPGDSFRISYESMLRFSALIAPIMHRVKVTQHYFFVPNRILWENWEKFITQETDIAPPTFSPYHSTYSNKGIMKGSVADYMGLPLMPNISAVEALDKVQINALPFAAYFRIIAEYYTDQNVQSYELDQFTKMSTLEDGDQGLAGNAALGIHSINVGGNAAWRVTGPVDRAWQHDYFTSALPWAQKGSQVEIPIGDFTDVPLEWTGNPVPFTDGDRLRSSDGNLFTPETYASIGASPTGILTSSGGGGSPRYLDNSLAMVAKTSELEVGSASINNLRRAFRLQEWLERNARGGTRYFESMMAHFGVRSPDARLQRPEYLGGSVQMMNISEVLSTAQTLGSEGEVVNPVGQMSGHGISVAGSKVLNYYAQEHGWIIGLISVLPDTAYQQGIHKKFFRNDVFDYYWPSFANIGEQEVLNQELYFDPAHPEVSNKGTFGYVPRYAEYKFENNRVAGEFRDTLNFWHLGRIFEERPTLSSKFIYSNPSTRIFAVEEGDHIYAHVLLKIKAVRKMPKFGTPSF